MDQNQPLRLVAVIGLALAAGFAVFGTGGPASAQACPTSVSVQPAEGQVGEKIEVSGVGWASNVDIFVNLDGKQLLTAKTDSSGAFSGSGLIPGSVASGSVLLFVQDGDALCEVQQQYTVAAGVYQCPTSVDVTPAEGWLDGPITISGSGWFVIEDIFVNLDGQQIAITGTNGSGSFNVDATIPDSVAPGNLLLFVQDGSATCEVQQQYTVTAQGPTTTTSTTSTTTTEPPATTLAPTTTTTETPNTTVAETTTSLQETTITTVIPTNTAEPQAVDEPSDGGSGLGTIAVVLGLALVAGGGGYLIYRRRQTH